MWICDTTSCGVARQGTSGSGEGALLLRRARLVWLQLSPEPSEVIALLKLKRVELQGFKSFCDRTELRFNGEGIAAIVGPNGCGKSNISDAISWVLGEQSAKSLRGARMEDVIFAGTRDRKALGMAHVTMTMVDPEVHGHKIQAVEEGQPKKPGEITITRRLFRSGESEYLIDG